VKFLRIGEGRQLRDEPNSRELERAPFSRGPCGVV